MNQIDLNEAKRKKPSSALSKVEKNEIIAYFEANPEDEKALPYIMAKYNISNTTVTIILTQHLMGAEQ